MVFILLAEVRQPSVETVPQESCDRYYGYDWGGDHDLHTNLGICLKPAAVQCAAAAVYTRGAS